MPCRKQYVGADLRGTGRGGKRPPGDDRHLDRARARATLLHPDFFDVVVSHVGPHDFRHLGPALTVDRFFGIPSATDPENDFYTVISNTRLVDRLKGNLLLIYGEIDENVPLVSSMIMYDALIKADKDFDTIIIPNAPHGTMMHPYAMRRQLEYFVEHLGGPVPIGD